MMSGVGARIGAAIRHALSGFGKGRVRVRVTVANRADSRVQVMNRKISGHAWQITGLVD